VLVAHGGGAAWNEQVFAVARQLEMGGPVGVAFLMTGDSASGHRFQDVVGRLADAGAVKIVVVPLLVSSHSGHYEQVRYLVGEADSLSPGMLRHLEDGGIAPPATPVPLVLTAAMDDSPEIAEALRERALSLAEVPEQQAVFIVGHGPNSTERAAAWMVNLRVLADSVRSGSPFRDVKVGLLRDDAPPVVRQEAVRRMRDIIQLQHELTGYPVVVVPVLIARGRITNEKIPADLAGMPVTYSGDALLPHPGVARWIEGRVRQAVSAAHAP
jgi:sirohydrochlorin ferrochelatase